MTGITLLKHEELNSLKEILPHWQIEQNAIKREWKFKNFIEAFGFITKVALLAEGMNHHPNLKNIYSSVSIELTTHDLGGISNLDLQLAKAINELDTYLTNEK